MRRAHLLATLSSIAALLIGVSCGSDSEGGPVGAGGTSGTAGRQNGAAGNESGGSSNGGSSNGGNSNGGSSNGGSSNGGSSNGGQSNGGAAGEGGASGSPGGVDAGGVDAGASEADAGVASAGDGEPCPNGECADGLVCVGYGNPLPNGESTACRRECTPEEPPPRCTCAGGGYCEESVGDPDAGSGTIGCGDTDAGCTCGEVIVDPGCADADDTTTDFQSGEFQGCLNWRDLGDGQGWIHYQTSGGFHYDLSTSLGWVIRSSDTMSRAEAADFCASFSIAGLSDWRLPTITEARSLAGGCANTAPGGSCPISDSSCLDANCGLSADCTSCSANAGPYAPGNYYCREDVMLCISFHTSSSCPDCSNPGGPWSYGPINGNFFAGGVAQEFFPVCVMENIPRAVPCRN